ncbi:MAG: hypothetical protein AAB613_00445 [Patescibacteria group bacterium]
MKPIYLEPDEEITSIIDRLSKVEGTKIAVVVPKNSTMFQSLVNLKLLARQAQKLGKEVAIISNNKVGSRLAKQVGLETYASLGTVGNTSQLSAFSDQQSAVPTADSRQPIAAPTGVDTLPDGTPIHRYSPEIGQLATNEKQPEETSEEVETTDVESEPETAVQTVTEDIAKDSPPSQEVPEVTNEPQTSSSDVPVGKPTGSLPPIISRGVHSHNEFIFPWKSAIVAAVMVLVAGVITFLFLPKATVTLTFPAKLLSETFALSAKTDPSSIEGTVSGNLLTVEKSNSKEITATGKKDIGTKAFGNISVKNCEDTNSHILNAGTKATSAGKVFLTSSTVNIPAGQFSGGGTVCNSTAVAVGVSAVDAGEAYNLSSATFSLSGLASRISGTGSTAGGTTKQITVLSQDDVSSSYSELKSQLLQDGTNELKGKSGNQIIIDEAIKSTVIEQKVDKEVGSQTDRATVSVTMELFTIAFDLEAVEVAAKDKLNAKIKENEQLIIPSDKKPTFIFKELTEDKTTLNIEVTSTGYAAPEIDKKLVAKEVKSKTSSGAKNFLKEKYGTEEITIEIIPGWWFERLPILSQAISIEYGFNEASPEQ